MSTPPLTDLIIHGVDHLAVHGTIGSTSYDATPPALWETFGGMLSAADTVVQRRDGPCRLCDTDDDDDKMQTQQQ